MPTKDKTIKRNRYNIVDTYYNTTKLQGNDLELAEKKALTQEQKVLFVFQKQKKPLSASQVQNLIDPIGFSPITSYRRAITNLMKLGYLQKTEKKIIGKYGRPEYQYKLK